MAAYERHSPYGGLRSVDGDDVVTGCWEWLRSKSDLMDLLGHIPGLPPLTPLLYTHDLDVLINGLETNAVVVKHAGGWGAPNSYNTLKFPRIELEFWCDALRDDLGQVMEVKQETLRRMNFIYEQFDKYMHRPSALEGSYQSSEGKIQMWGTVRTIECTRLGEFAFNSVPDGDGLFLGNVYYGVQMG